MFTGDQTLLAAAHLKARTTFQENAHLSPSSPEAEEQIAHAEGVAQVLRENVVQGEKIEDRPQETYKLRIHEHTERGDNESVKSPKAAEKVERGKGTGGCGFEALSWKDMRQRAA